MIRDPRSPTANPAPRLATRIFSVLLVAAVYFGAARLGLLLASVHGSVSPVWPATGVAIASLLLGGFGLWPGVALGAFAANALTPVSLAVVAAITAGNTLEALAGAWIVSRCIAMFRRHDLEYLAPPAGFVLAAAVGPVISASVGVASLFVAREITLAIAPTLWWTWWVGDALGALMIAPLLLAGRDATRDRLPRNVNVALKAIAVLGAAMAVSALVFFQPAGGRFLFAIFPVLLLAVAWFGSLGVKAAAALISAVGISAAFFGSGPFAGGSLNEDLLHLQLFLTSVAIAALILPIFRAAGRLLAPSVLMLAAWGLSGWLFSALHADRIKSDAAHFDALVADTATNIRHRFATYEDSLRGGAGLFVAAKSVGRAEWHAYAEALHLPERYPGIQGIGVALPVRAENRAAFLATMRADYGADFAIHSVNSAPADNVREQFVVAYLEPLETNRAAIGLDLASEENRRLAAEQARDTGEPRVTPRITLVQDAKQRPGFVLFVPLYRAGAPRATIDQRRTALAGWVTAPFVTEAFLNGVLGSGPREVALQVFEGDSIRRDALLYASHGGETSATDFERVTHLELGGRIFTLGWKRGPEFLAAAPSAAMWAATSSALVSLLMVGLVVSLQSVSARARALAAERTTELATAQAELRTTNAMLESRVTERTKSLSQAITELSEAERRLEQRVALRTEELAASEERFRLLIDNVQDYAIFALDAAGCVTTWNTGAERAKGYPAAEIIGRHFSVFYPPQEIAEGLPASDLAAAAAQGRTVTEGWRMRKDGTRYWASVTLTALRHRDGTLVGFAKFSRDITESKRLEENLAHARDDALQASRLKSEFLATMSHEIRTPMNGIIGMSSLLMETTLNPEQRNMGRVIQNSAESLLGIINDILDFSKIEAGKLRLEAVSFDLRPVIEETLALLAPRAHEKKLELICDFDPRLNAPLAGDAGRIRQVLTNLAGNAIKFTETGEIVVIVRCVGTPGPRTTFRVTVSDTGVGVPPEARGRLFEPFTQGDGTATRRFGGTGLGLAICRQLVDLMGGTIGYESAPGRGATFWFEIDLPTGTANPDAEALLALPPGLRVLAVDDNETNRRIVREQLAHFGVQAEVVPDAAAALMWLRAQAAAGTPCQLVLLDWHMPRMNGLELAVAIRGDTTIASVPLVMLSSADAVDDQVTAAKVGFAAFLVKPVREAQLHRCLARVLGGANALATATASEANGKTPAPPAGGLRLLLVEDTPANQMVAKMMFEKMGHSVVVANHGGEALAKLGQQTFDAVIMDCQMPVMDGYECTRRIRSGKEPGVNSAIPIIALTAHALPADRQKCLAAGMDDYMSKPVRPAAVKEAFLRCGLLKRETGVVTSV